MEEESGTCRGGVHPHNGYCPGDFSSTDRRVHGFGGAAPRHLRLVARTSTPGQSTLGPPSVKPRDALSGSATPTGEAARGPVGGHGAYARASSTAPVGGADHLKAVPAAGTDRLCPLASDVSPESAASGATLHCLTGRAIGEILGLVLGTAMGLSNTGTLVLAIVLAFVFGYSLSTLPLLRAGWGSPRRERGAGGRHPVDRDDGAGRQRRHGADSRCHGGPGWLTSSSGSACRSR